MKGFTAVSGKTEQPQQALTLHSFARAFIAGLIARNCLAVRPQNPSDRKGFASVVRVLDDAVSKLEEKGEDSRTLLQLVRIANDLRPSNSGAFDGFEAALRSMQLTLASCPNPFYEDIVFSVPRSYAQATIDNLPDSYRGLVDSAVDAFVKEAVA